MSSSVNKIVRYSLIVIGLVVVGLLAAPLFIDVNSYKNKIEQSVEDATGRALHIGSIQASLFPWIGVELEDVHLANRQGFSKEDFLSIQHLNVKLALLPLFSRQVEIKTFEVQAPKVLLERHKGGETNWGDLVSTSPVVDANATPASSHDRETSPAQPLLAALQAELITLHGGEVKWRDAGAKALLLSDLNIKLSDVQLERPLKLQLSGKLSGNNFAVDAELGPIGDLAKLDPLKLPIQGSFEAQNIQLALLKPWVANWPQQLGAMEQASLDVNMKMEQHPDGIRLMKGSVGLHSLLQVGLNWKLEMDGDDRIQLRQAIVHLNNKKLLAMKGRVTQLSSGDPRFRMRLESESLTRNWLAGYVPALTAMYADHPSAWKQIKVTALLAGSSQQLEIRDMQLMLDKELLQVSGAVIYAIPDIRLRIAARELHLDPWLPQGKEKPAVANSAATTAGDGATPVVADTGSARDGTVASEQAEPDLRFLKSWRVTAKMQASTLYVRGMAMQNFHVKINGSDGRFDMNPLSFKLSGGKVDEKASLNVAAYPVQWRESVQISDVQVGPLLRALADMDMLEGTLSMDSNMHGIGLTPAAVKHLNGRGNVMLRNGKVKGIDVAGAIRRFTNPSAKQGAKETDFAQLSGSFVIRNGMVDNQDLFMASPLLRVTGKGNINLVAKVLDYHITPRVVGTLIGQGDAVPVRKGLTLPLHITGAFADPKIRPELNAKALIQNAPTLLNKGGLGALLGGKKGTQSSPQKPERSPEQKILRGLQGVFPGL